MATSGSTNFQTTRDEIIKYAWMHCGVIDEEGTPSTAQIKAGAFWLNALIKSWQTYGDFLWCMKRQSITLVSGTRVYRVGEGQTVNTPKPLRLYQAYLRQTSDTTDKPLEIVSRQQYELLSDKTSTGSPNQIYAEVLSQYTDIYMFPAPDATTASGYTVQIIYQRPIEDFDAANDDLDMPSEWIAPTTWYLAYFLSVIAGVNPTDRKEIFTMADMLLANALSGDRENASVFLTPRRKYGKP